MREELLLVARTNSERDKKQQLYIAIPLGISHYTFRSHSSKIYQCEKERVS